MIKYDLLKTLNLQYGDSFYILDINEVKTNFNLFLTAFLNKYENTHIAYSYKTNYIPHICKTIHMLGGRAEVVSEMEYEMAKKNNVSDVDIFYNGPYKKFEYLKKMIVRGVHINLDNYEEFDYISKIASEYGKPYSIGLRCNFNIGLDRVSRFGFDVEDPCFFDMIGKIKNHPNIKLTGLHAHFPERRLFSFVNRADKMQTLLLKLKSADFLKDLKYVSFGGGFYGKKTEDVAFLSDMDFPSFSDYAEPICRTMNMVFDDIVNKPELILEPGTAIVADTMSFFTKIISIKTVRGKNYATLSGSTYNINPSVKNINRPINLYSEKERIGEKKEYDFVGYTCIEDDVLYRNFYGNIEVGDYVIFNNVGSYSVVFKPPFILPNVPIIMIDDDKIIEIKRQETLEDILVSYN